MIRIAFYMIGLLLFPLQSGAQQVTAVPPEKPDPAKHYLFYMHGLAVETRGPNVRHPRYDNADHQGVVEALAKKGFHVIAELRSAGTNPVEYAQKVAGQVRTLLDAAVPAANIVVTGFSKGGSITIATAAVLDNPAVRFVVMAGCGIGPFADNFARQVEADGPKLKGRMLSLYEAADREGGSCQAAFAKAGPDLVASEKVLDTGAGHGLFFRPQAVWIDAVADWAMR